MEKKSAKSLEKIIGECHCEAPKLNGFLKGAVEGNSDIKFLCFTEINTVSSTETESHLVLTLRNFNTSKNIHVYCFAILRYLSHVLYDSGFPIKIFLQ